MVNTTTFCIRLYLYYTSRERARSRKKRSPKYSSQLAALIRNRLSSSSPSVGVYSAFGPSLLVGRCFVLRPAGNVNQCCTLGTPVDLWPGLSGANRTIHYRSPPLLSGRLKPGHYQPGLLVSNNTAILYQESDRQPNTDTNRETVIRHA